MFACINVVLLVFVFIKNDPLVTLNAFFFSVTFVGGATGGLGRCMIPLMNFTEFYKGNKIRQR